jgi:NADH-quinone oxidoreductase subunit L
MTVPLMLLCVGAVASGWVGIPHLLGGGAHFTEFMRPVLGHLEGHGTHAEEWLVMAISVIAGFSGIGLAAFVYLREGNLAAKITQKFAGVHRVLWNKYYVDELYDLIIVRPTIWVARSVIVGVTDGKIIEGVVNGVPSLIGRFSSLLRSLQTGMVQQYAAVMAIGAFVVIALVLLW